MPSIGSVTGFFTKKLAKRWVKKALYGLLAIALASILGSAFLYIRGAEQAKAKVPELERKLDQAQAAARLNQESFEACYAINEYNAAEAELQRVKARIARAEVEALRTRADAIIEDVNREVEAFRDEGLYCPAITDDFRRWVRGDM